MEGSEPLTRRRALGMAWPLIAANVSTPLVGLVDVAVIGRGGDARALAAVALGSVVFNTLYWALGFLRMGTTGLTAQAAGVGDRDAVDAELARAVLVAAVCGGLLVVFAGPLETASFAAFSGSEAVEALGGDYFAARILGAPASLVGLAVYGWLIGLGRTREGLRLRLVLNVLNGVLAVAFVSGLGLGVAGLGAAAALAQWLHLVSAVAVVRTVHAEQGGEHPPSLARILDGRAVARLFGVNRDILIRTLALLGGFYWFNEASLRVGEDVLAGNAILLQLVSASAFFLDSFAFLAEGETGRAVGARSIPALRHGIRVTAELTMAFAGACTVAIAVLGRWIVPALTTDPAAREVALAHLGYCAWVPLVGAPSWHLDGIMIGATRGRLMRNGMIVALGAYLALDAWLRPAYGGDGLWLAFLGYYVARAGVLAAGYPALERDLRRATTTRSP